MAPRSPRQVGLDLVVVQAGRRLRLLLRVPGRLGLPLEVGSIPAKLEVSERVQRRLASPQVLERDLDATIASHRQLDARRESRHRVGDLVRGRVGVLFGHLEVLLGDLREEPLEVVLVRGARSGCGGARRGGGRGGAVIGEVAGGVHGGVGEWWADRLE